MLYVGSASRGDPGPAAIGAVIKAYPDYKLSVVWRAGKSIGEKTRNEAELEALLFGMERALGSDYKHVLAMTDSDMVVKLVPVVKIEVTSSKISQLLLRVHKTSQRFCRFSLEHIPRSSNREADSKANQALDKAVPSARIQEDSVCPVCFELFEPPVFQCPKGHLICEGCLDDLLRRSENEPCPECRTPYEGLRIPNVVADDLIKQWRPLQITMEEPIATYKLQFALNMREGPTHNSATVGHLISGSYVDIFELKIDEKGDYIYGRMQSGEWITLEKMKEPKFASRVSLGTYKANILKSTYDGFQINSLKTGKLRAGDFVDIVETKFMSDDHCLWGKIANGNWMILENTRDRSEFATPIPLGTYKITNSEAQLRSDIGLTGGDKIGKYLQGDLVDIVETKVVAEEGRVRAKTHVGTWMSLVNLNDGSVWAKPLEIAEAEEEEARREEQARRELQARTEEQARLEELARLEEQARRWEEQARRKEQEEQDRRERTCKECDRVFGSVRAMNQHYDDTHYIDECTCPYCDREFGSPEAMNQHYEDVHPCYECEHGCDRDFWTEEALEQHNRAKHPWLFR